MSLNSGDKSHVFVVINNVVRVFEVYGNAELMQLQRRLQGRMWLRDLTGDCFKCWLDMHKPDANKVNKPVKITKYTNFIRVEPKDIPTNILMAMTLVE